MSQHPTAQRTRPCKEDMATTYLKRILLVFHSFVLVLSAISFICGLYVYFEHIANDHESWHMNYGIFNGSVFTITISIIFISLSILGIVGASLKNVYILLTSSVFLALIILTKFSLLITIFVLAKQHKLGQVIEKPMMKSLQHFEKSGYDGVTKFWNLIQNDLMCCGVYNASNWYDEENNSFSLFTYPNLPDSCCEAVQVMEQCKINKINFGPFQNGCLLAIESTILDNSGAIATLVVILVALKIGIFVVTILLVLEVLNRKISDRQSDCDINEEEIEMY